MGRFSDKKKGSLNKLKSKANDNVNNNNDVNNNVDDISANTDDNSNDNVYKNKNTNNNINQNNNNVNNNDNKITLKKEEETKLVGLYLKQRQIEKLEKLANETDKSKSEIGRLAIDYFYQNVEIE